MCKRGNGSIYEACRDKLFKRDLHTNREMRAVIHAHDGCLDTKTAKALVEVAARAAEILES